MRFCPCSRPKARSSSLRQVKCSRLKSICEFHRRIYAGRGLIDAPRVLAAAEVIGLDRQELAEAANTESMLAVLKQNADFGSDAKLIATPAYVVNGVAILGHPGLKSLQGVIRSVRSCRKVAC